MSLLHLPVSVASLLGIRTSFARSSAQSAVMTPFQRLRRFDVPQAGFQPDWDLIVREHRVRASGARILHLFGEVLSFEGAAIADAVVEIRQCDMQGRMPEDGIGVGDFLGVGRTVTDFEGRYQFRTILPVCSAGRTARIEAQVTPPVGRKLSTQLYLLDHPANQADWDFQALGPSRQAAVSLDPIERADGDLDAGFNFVL